MNISRTVVAFRGDGKYTTIVHTSEINGDSILYWTHIVHPIPKKNTIHGTERVTYERN